MKANRKFETVKAIRGDRERKRKREKKREREKERKRERKKREKERDWQIVWAQPTDITKVVRRTMIFS